MSLVRESYYPIEGHPKTEFTLESLVSLRILQPVSATNIDNTCVFANKEVSSTLDVAEGLRSSLGCQVSLGPLKRNPDRLVYGMEQHNRSSILSSESGISWRGANFKYLDAKGTGYLEHVSTDINSVDNPKYLLRVRPSVNKIVKGESDDLTTWGGTSLDWNDKDIELSEHFADLGIRTIPIVACLKLNQVLDSGGNILSIEEAKQKKIILETDEPGIILRGFVTPFRLKDVLYNPDEKDMYGIETTTKDIERKRNILLKAIEDTKEDISIPLEVRKTFEDPNNYAVWLSSTIGEQVKLMHKNGYVHGYLSALHNITLDARVMDLDSALEDYPENMVTELNELVSPDVTSGALLEFFKGICHLLDLKVSPKELGEIVRKSYL